MKHALTVACNPGTGEVSDIAEIKGVSRNQRGQVSFYNAYRHAHTLSILQICYVFH
jgi:hypothetical protein